MRAGEEAEKKEYILLDAVIQDVIEDTAFRARLKNGHEFVAYVPRHAGFTFHGEPGGVVRVRFSPFDMSRGAIIADERDVET